MGSGGSRDAPRTAVPAKLTMKSKYRDPRATLEEALRPLDDARLRETFDECADDTCTAGGERNMTRAGVLRAMGIIHAEWTPADVNGVLARFDFDADGKISYDEFYYAARSNSTLEMLVRSLAVERAIAAALPAGTVDDPLAGLAAMTEAAIAEAVAKAARPIAAQLNAARERLVRGKDSLEEQARARGQKFGHQLRGGRVEAFYAGVTGIVGQPRANLEEGIRREHTTAKDATTPFSTGNYGVTTTPATEYAVACGLPEAGVTASGDDTLPARITSTRRAPGGARAEDDRRLRSAKDFGDFDEDGTLRTRTVTDADSGVQQLVKRAGLTRPEVISLVLYTGPMFTIYNAILRGFGSCGTVASDVEFASDAYWAEFSRTTVADRVAASGNKYAATIHCLASAVKKLERVAGCRQGERVYRGLGGLDPSDFVVGTGFTELAFMSTTRDLHVAMNEYSGVRQGRMGCVLAMEMSEVDRGADLREFSQYPGEEEVLWNACAYVENVAGREEVHITDAGPVRVLLVKANANSRAQTVEELQTRRKGIVANMCETMAEDAAHMLDARVEAREFDERIAIEEELGIRRGTWGKFGPADKDERIAALVGNTKRGVDGIVRYYRGLPTAAFLEDASFACAVRTAVMIPKLARAQIATWMECKSTSSTLLASFGLKTVARIQSGHRRMQMQAARERQDVAALRQLAMEDCLAEGWCTSAGALGECDWIGETPLYSACADGNVLAVRTLIEAGVSVTHDPASDLSPMVGAVISGKVEIVDMLCAAGADCNRPGRNGYTPLFASGMQCSAQVLHHLAAQGADFSLECAGMGVVDAILTGPNPFGFPREPALAAAVAHGGRGGTKLNAAQRVRILQTLDGVDEESRARMLKLLERVEAMGDVNVSNIE